MVLEMYIENFTPFSAFFGGMLIGLSVILLLFLKGRITGISGMMYGVIEMRGKEKIWRAAFLVGVILGAIIFQIVMPGFMQPRQGYPLWLLIPGGFLVGLGTRIGSGCTSGHGICGIARLSMRSILATLVFMTTGIITVFVIRHGLGVV